MQDVSQAPRDPQGTCKQCGKKITHRVSLDGFIEAANNMPAKHPNEPGMMLGGVIIGGRFCSVTCATVMLEGWGRSVGRKPSDF